MENLRVLGSLSTQTTKPHMLCNNFFNKFLTC